MSSRTDRFYHNQLYQLLSNASMYSTELLQEFNFLLHQQPELVEYDHPDEGSFFHLICRNSTRLQSVAFRMIYSLSNAGGDPNITDGNGNTPLHEAIIRGLPDCGFDLIQALFRVGVDQRIVNHEGKIAEAYLGDNPQLHALYKSYGDGIWAAIETSNILETERLIQGFIKTDCKHNSNKTLLDKARDINCTSIIDILADYQVTTEFLHSILACDWQRASIIYQHESQFIKVDSLDTIHRLTFIRTYSKSLLESCLDTQSSEPFAILYSSPTIQVNVNVLCTDGLPFFFHSFDPMISDEIRKKMLFNCNMYMKSSKGETILFYLLRLYSEQENPEYLKVFTEILSVHPLLLSERNEHEQTIIELIEFAHSMVMYKKYRPFYNTIVNLLKIQLKRNSMIEQYLLNQFGYYFLIFFRDQTLRMTKHVYKLLRSLKFNRGLAILIPALFQAVIDDNLTKLKSILKMKTNIYQAKDSFGRTAAHLAILYQRYDILKFLCDNYSDLINAKDNLSRTAYHYACIMKDITSTELLERANAKQIIDCLNLCPNDYVINRDLCSEEFTADEFSRMEIERQSTFRSNHLKLAFYSRLKQAIEKNSSEEIKSIHQELMQMGFDLKDFNPNSYLNDYVQGERYIPFLFLGIEHRAIAALKCLIELGIPRVGLVYMSKSTINAGSRWMSFRSRAEELECFDIIDIINDLEDDVELKAVFQQDSSIDENPVKTEDDSHVEENPSGDEKMIKQFFPNYINQSHTCIVL